MVSPLLSLPSPQSETMSFYSDPLAISPFFPISCPFGVQSGLGLRLSSHVHVLCSPPIHTGGRHQALRQLPAQLLFCLYAPAHLCLAACKLSAGGQRGCETTQCPPQRCLACQKPLHVLLSAARTTWRIPLVWANKHCYGKDHRTGVMHKATVTYF